MTPMAQPQTGPQSSFGQFLASTPAPVDNVAASNNMAETSTSPQKFGGSPLEKGTASMTSGLAKKGMAASRGGLADGGGPVNAKKDSEKAVKSGNSYSNDKIPAMLSEGEVVLPRSVTQSKDPARAAANFVSKVLAKRKVRK